MTSPVLKPIAPPITPPLEWLPPLSPANDNIELKAIEIAEERWGMQAAAEAEGVLSKCLRLGGGVALRGLSFFLMFADFQGDTPSRRYVVVDKPPQGKGVSQWLDEMAEMARIVALIQSAQAEVHQHEQNGNSFLAQQAKEKLESLFSQLTTISNAYPGASRSVHIMNNAGGAAASDAPTAGADKSDSKRDVDPNEAVPGLENRNGLWYYRPDVALQAGATALFDTESTATPSSLVGKTLVVVGGVYAGRQFLLEEPQRVASELGMRMLLVDRGRCPDSVEPEDFVQAPVREHDREVLMTTTDTVEERVRTDGHNVVGVTVFYNPLLPTGIAIRDGLGTFSNRLRGDGIEQFQLANEKHQARVAMEKAVPEIAVPHAAFTNAINDIEGTLLQVRAAYERITAGDPNKRVVIKPIQAADKIGVRTNISSADEAVAVAREIDAQMRALLDDPELGQSVSVGSYPGLLMELQLEGPEVDVEVVMGPDSAIAFVIGNPRPQSQFPQERGFSVPSPLPDYAQQALVVGALKAMKATGLRTGNYHVEMKWTPDGPRVIEFNTRMGGGNIFLVAEQVWGLNLIEQGIRALVGLPLVAPSGESHGVVVSRYVLPEFTGSIESISGTDEASETANVTDVLIKRVPGDSIVTPRDGLSDKLGYVVAQAETYDLARSAVMSAMALINIVVRRPDGSTATQRGDYGQNPPDCEILCSEVCPAN